MASWFWVLTDGKVRWHEKAVTGIALPSGSNKLLSSDDDDDNMNIGAVWGFHSDKTQAEFVLICPNGLAYALVMAGIILFVGVQVQKLGTSFAMQAALLTRDTDFVTSVPR